MYKRVIILFSLMLFSLGALVMQIIRIDAGDYAKSAALNNTKSITVDTARGTIYDCNMKPITNSEKKYIAALKPTSLAISSIKDLISNEDTSDLAKRLSKGTPAVVSLKSSQEIDCDDIKILSLPKRYSNKQLAAHIIGYLDSTGKGLTGIEESYNSYLSDDMGDLKVAFSVDAYGKALAGADISVISNNYNIYKGVQLTIDKRIQKIAENVLDENNIGSGCAVILDVDSGEIRALASRPTYNPNNLGDSLKSADSPLINRCLTAYTVGSIFKPVVASAALESGKVTTSLQHNCTGSTDVNGTIFSCFNGKSHGVLDMQGALVNSCNTYFINLLTNYDFTDELLNMADSMGFGSSTKLAEKIASDKGYLPTASDLDSKAALANFAFGQGKLMATPLQIAAAYLSIASKGYYREPYLVKALVDENGSITQKYSADAPTRVMSQQTAETVTNMLVNVVNEGQKGKPDNVAAAGKTATAQSGWIVNGVEVCHAWFAGFFPADNPKYVVVVMKENGTTGALDCAPIFKQIAEQITDLNS